MNFLIPGDHVRIKRRTAAGFSKQSLPFLSYDVHKVKEEYNRGRDWVHVPLRRIKNVHHEQAGLYTTPSPRDVDEPEPIYHSRLVRIKTFEIGGRRGQTIDPPPGPRWAGFFSEINSGTFTKRQTIEGDYYI